MAVGFDVDLFAQVDASSDGALLTLTGTFTEGPGPQTPELVVDDGVTRRRFAPIDAAAAPERGWRATFPSPPASSTRARPSGTRSARTTTSRSTCPRRASRPRRCGSRRPATSTSAGSTRSPRRARASTSSPRSSPRRGKPWSSSSGAWPASSRPARPEDGDRPRRPDRASSRCARACGSSSRASRRPSPAWPPKPGQRSYTATSWAAPAPVSSASGLVRLVDRRRARPALARGIASWTRCVPSVTG